MINKFWALLVRASGALVGALILWTVPATANEWPVADMNRTIDQTNFEVGKGCSGTLISVEHRLILTNHHCIEQAVVVKEREMVDGESGEVRKIKTRKLNDVLVQQHFFDGATTISTSAYVTTILAQDKSVDLAVLQVKGNLPNVMAAPIGGDVVRGERIYIVGNPLGEYSSVTTGIVSSVQRDPDLPWTGGTLKMLQVSGGVVGGNSGGALYNVRGELVGVPAAGYPSAVTIGFAIPASVVKAFLAKHKVAL
jgi:S1-C subfamily serine protease